MGRTRLSVKRLTLDAMLLVFALMLSYIESVLSIALLIPIPGFRLGLANICTMLCMYYLGIYDAFFVLIARIILSALLFSSPISMIYSLFGGILSFIAMITLMKVYNKGNVSFIGISVFAAFSHNAGQIAAACFMFGNFSPVYYLSYLTFIALFTGALTGLIVNLLYIKLRKIKK